MDWFVFLYALGAIGWIIAGVKSSKQIREEKNMSIFLFITAGVVACPLWFVSFTSLTMRALIKYNDIYTPKENTE